MYVTIGPVKIKDLNVTNPRIDSGCLRADLSTEDGFSGTVFFNQSETILLRTLIHSLISKETEL